MGVKRPNAATQRGNVSKAVNKLGEEMREAGVNSIGHGGSGDEMEAPGCGWNGTLHGKRTEMGSGE